MRTSSCLSPRVLLGVAALTSLFVTATVNAGPSKTSRATPESARPPTQGKKSAEYKAVAAYPGGARGHRLLHGLRPPDRQGRRHSNDAFGTRFENFDKTLVAGLNSDRPNLDTKARYLYLYQIVNDSGLQAGVKDITIRLLVPTTGSPVGPLRRADEERQDRPGRTAGPGLLDHRRRQGKGRRQRAAAVRNAVRPVSTDFQGVNSPDEPYTLPGTPHQAPKTYGVTRIGLLPRARSSPPPPPSGPARIRARSPNTVMLLRTPTSARPGGWPTPRCTELGAAPDRPPEQARPRGR